MLKGALFLTTPSTWWITVPELHQTNILLEEEKGSVQWVSSMCVCVWTWSFGREGLVSWESLVSLPDRINQHVAHGRNKLENKKSIKVSEWNRGRENSFMMKLNSPYSAVDPLPPVWLFTPDTIHHYAATNDSNYHTCYSYNTHTTRA